MTGPLDLKAVLFLTAEETAELFRRDKAWVYRNRDGILKPAARRFGPKTLLFLQAELERLIEKAADPPASVRKRSIKRFAVKAPKPYNGSVPEGPGPEDQGPGDATDAQA